MQPSPQQATADVIAWLQQAPAGTFVLASEIVSRLVSANPTSPPIQPRADATWRERLWTVPADTRLGVRELAEALDRSADFVYRHTAPGGTVARIPHRKLDGALVFAAGEIREWIKETEIVVATTPMTPKLGRQLRIDSHRTTPSKKPTQARRA